MKKTLFPLFWLLLASVMNCCVSLKHVNEYSVNALTGLTKYEKLSLDFEKACKMHCFLDKLDSLQTDIDQCYCAADRKADSVTLLIYNAIKGYFDGLASLSDNELTSYKMDELSAALASDELGKVKLSEEQANAYTAISGILLRAFTDGYRKKRIGIYIKEANEPVNLLLNYLDFNIAKNLQGKINVLKERYILLTDEFIDDESLSLFDKKTVLLLFYEKMDEATRWEQEIVVWSKALQKIKEGHRKLAENAANLKAIEVKRALLQYASDIEDIISEINKLKTN